MSIAIGEIVEGTVVKTAAYGAIVRLQCGAMGLIHISEIADTFVRDVNDYFRERVRVRVLALKEKNRYELSAKNVEQPLRDAPQINSRPKRAAPAKEAIYLGPEESDDCSRTCRHGLPFEKMLADFTKESQERLLDLRRNMESKRGVKSR
jgi:S1 RNA binding domain protein